MGTRRSELNSSEQDLKDVTPARTRLLSRITTQSRFYWVRQLLENPSAVMSMGFIGLLVILTLAVPTLSGRDLAHMDPTVRLLPPSNEFLVGTDHMGRDVLLRGIYGARISLLVGLSVMLLAGACGTVIGLATGYYHRIDTPVMRVMDGIMAFPAILLAIAIMASLGSSTVNVIFALGLVFTPIVARLVRGSTLSIKQQPYVEAARAIGARDYLILARHVFPNTLSPLIVQCTFIVALAIIAEASLSFLGAGVPPHVPTWGAMLRDGQDVINVAWWMVLVPGVLLFFTVLSLNMIGDALRDALDPRSRER
jgi:peptide/nickel transport system permease protein